MVVIVTGSIELVFAILRKTRGNGGHSRQRLELFGERQAFQSLRLLLERKLKSGYLETYSRATT